MRTWLSKFALMATFGLAMAFPFSCSLLDDKGDDSSSSGGGGNTPNLSSPGGNPGSSSSSPGEYQPGYNPTIAKWMTTNLPYATDEGSVCFKGNTANCNEYGRLYNWAAAMDLPQKCNAIRSTNDTDCRINTPHRGLCPEGKHIPTRTEWDALVNAAGGPSAATKTLKSSGWSSWSIYNGTDDYGFAAKHGGYGNADGTFYTAEDVARWWSASEDNATYAYSRMIKNKNSDAVSEQSNDKNDFSSVRCLDN